MGDTRSVSFGWLDGQGEGPAREVLALVIAWSAAEPQRIGEVALVEPGEPLMLGRGAAEPGDEHARASFARQRPGVITPAPPIEGPAISHDQVLLEPTPEGIKVQRRGRCAMAISGAEVDRGLLRPGETLALKRQLLLYCARRPAVMPGLVSYPREWHAFGEPDAHGIVGESAAAWEMRDQLAFVAGAAAHVLLLGESGSGKELAAQAIHRLSPRGERPMVSRNAATFPPGIIDAELFGNVKDYPNPGMEQRPGVIGEANGSSLFLDEIAELPHELQAHLLRVLDAGGEYQRLGDAQPRRADLRLIAATNRDPAELKHDLLARLTLRVSLPGLGARREDIPLVVRHLLRRAAAKSPAVAERFFTSPPDRASPLGHGEPRVDPDLVDALLRHQLTHHVRELDQLLWQALAESKGRYVAFTDGLKGAVQLAAAAPAALEEVSAEAVRAALARHDGKVARAYRDLGLKSRYALYRLMRKYGIEESA
jgi:two-component system nitrogen regulation response regulator GlnG/two-component system response regulator HydG